VTSYASVPSQYNRQNYQYSTGYNRQQAFMLPIGMNQQLAAKMMQASQAFRQFDTNYSGSLNKKEFKRAMWSMGYYLQKPDRKRLFRMIDRDNSGQISEREFCEYWASTH